MDGKNKEEEKKNLEIIEIEIIEQEAEKEAEKEGEDAEEEEMPKEEMLKKIAEQQAAVGESGGASNLVYQCNQVKQRVRNQVFTLEKIKEVKRSFSVLDIIFNASARELLKTNGKWVRIATRAKKYFSENCDKDGCTPQQERISKMLKISSLLNGLWKCANMAKEIGWGLGEPNTIDPIAFPRGAVEKWRQATVSVNKLEQELQKQDRSTMWRRDRRAAVAAVANVRVDEAIKETNDMNNKVIESNEKLLDALKILDKYMGMSKENWNRKKSEMLVARWVPELNVGLRAIQTMINEVMKMGSECKNPINMVQMGVSQMVTKINENKNEAAPISGGRKRRRKTRKVKKSHKHREGKKSKKTYLLENYCRRSRKSRHGRK